MKLATHIILAGAIAITASHLAGCANLSPYGRNTTHPMDPTASTTRVPTGSPFGNIAGTPGIGFFDNQGDYWAPTGRTHTHTVVVREQVPSTNHYSPEDHISGAIDKLFKYCVNSKPKSQDYSAIEWDAECLLWAKETVLERAAEQVTNYGKQ